MYSMNQNNPYALQMQNLQNQFQQLNPYQQSQQNGIQYVNGIESVKAYQLDPNSSVLLMDNNLPRFYVKTTDAAGMASIKTFEFHEYIEEKPQKIDPEQFVTRTEFEELKKMIMEKGTANESVKSNTRESRKSAAERQ